MNAYRVCASRKSILYIDDAYQCWIFILQPDKPVTPIIGSALIHYCTQGFGDYSGEQIQELVDTFSVTDSDYVPHVIEDISRDTVYDPLVMPWYDRLLFHPTIGMNEYKRPSVINYVHYSNEGIQLCTNEFLNWDIEEMIPLTDAELEAFKVGPITASWPVVFPKEKVLCYVDKVCSKDYIDVIVKYNAEHAVFIDDNDYEDEAEAIACGTRYAMPISDDDLEAFKIGYTGPYVSPPAKGYWR